MAVEQTVELVEQVLVRLEVMRDHVLDLLLEVRELRALLEFARDQVQLQTPTIRPPEVPVAPTGYPVSPYPDPTDPGWYPV